MPTLRMLAKSHVSKTPDIKESLGVIRGGRVVLEQVLVGLHPLLLCALVSFLVSISSSGRWGYHPLDEAGFFWRFAFDLTQQFAKYQFREKIKSVIFSILQQRLYSNTIKVDCKGSFDTLIEECTSPVPS